MPKLASREVCTGCRSCYNACQHSALEMKENGEGFFFPEVNTEVCVECGLCTKSCPELIERRFLSKEPPKAYALINERDLEVSSSGGAFSAIARYIFEKGGVVFGATMGKDGFCCHRYAETLEDIAPMRGSKYVQSNIGESYKMIKQFLADDRLVLFTGTPCQVAGLRAYLRKPYDKLVTVDIVCHGVPSNKVFKAYIQKLQQNRPIFARIEGFEFRQLNGWGKSPSIKLGSKFYPLYGVDNLYMEAFDKCALLRSSCYRCRYAKIPRQGDLTIGDFWGIGRHGRVFTHKTNNGVSLVFTNNQKGQSILSNIGGCIIEERTFEEAIAENPNIYRASLSYKRRDDLILAFLDETKSMDEIEQDFHLVDHSLKGKIKILAIRMGLFDFFKCFYNYCRSHQVL